MTLQDHFDDESLDMLREVMEEEFDELITLFLDDCESRLPKMNEALAQQDVTGLGGQAHSFKGASGNVCAIPLSDCNKKLEDMLRDRKTEEVDWEEASRLLSAIQQEFIAVKACIQNNFC